jgi:tRNA dimethylallyltransferase
MPNDAQRIERALEVHHVSGRPMSELLREDERAKLPYRLLKIALLPSERAVLHQLIAQRFDAMLRDGLLNEVARLRRDYPDLSQALPSMRCVGYRQAWQYLDGELDFAALREKGIAATRQLAKRQMTWLRGMDDVQVLDCLQPDVLATLEQCLQAVLLPG